MSLSREFSLHDLEFQYYCSLLEELVFLLPNRCQQIIAIKWNRKLTDPIYNADFLKEKRNHYLLMLTICLNLRTLKHPFNILPPSGVLQDTCFVQNPNKSDLNCKSNFPNEKAKKSCDLHEFDCPTDEHNISKVLDEQFDFLIHLTKMNIETVLELSDRRRGREWIKFLLSIDAECFQIKAVRNDYAMLLSGYVLYGELLGPFLQSPIEKLIPLCDLVKLVDMDNHMVNDPYHPKAMKFLKDIPHPKNGAFAFLSVTGNSYGQ